MAEENKPRLVDTGSGFSILYRGRLLYSKYSPARSVTSVVQKLELLPSTLVIINSPCLFYGLTDLLKKIPEDCFLVAVEDDENLFSVALDSIDKIKNENPGPDFSKVVLLSTKDLLGIDSFFRRTVDTGKIRRVVQIDFSAGKAFNPKMYEMVFSAAQEIVATFWKNRITLVKMGRLFSKNIVENLKSIDSGTTLGNVAGTVSKPILVLGAGESLDETLKPGSPFAEKVLRGDFFTVAVDASLTTVLDRGIKVDAVVGLESQFAIQKAYIGSEGCGAIFFADICSRPQVQRFFRERTVWFASDFAPARFLDRIKTFLPDFIPPLGSVGLAAVYVALRLRLDDSVPIFVTGLDFSYSIGKTHAKGTPAHTSRLSTSDRFLKVENLDASFSQAAVVVQGKDGKNMATTPAMLSYRQNFVNNFSAAKNLFDIGKSGIELGIQKIDEKSAALVAKKIEDSVAPARRIDFEQKVISGDGFKKNIATNFLKTEREALVKIRDLLSNGEKSKYFENGSDISGQIKNLLEDREYLYLHFPDGYRLSMDQGFLKRVRAEIDFFLKLM